MIYCNSIFTLEIRRAGRKEGGVRETMPQLLQTILKAKFRTAYLLSGGDSKGWLQMRWQESKIPHQEQLQANAIVV
jgi:hypothetical protein